MERAPPFRQMKGGQCDQYRFLDGETVKPGASDLNGRITAENLAWPAVEIGHVRSVTSSFQQFFDRLLPSRYLPLVKLVLPT